METKHLKTILGNEITIKKYWIPFGKGSSTFKPLMPNIYPLFKLYKNHYSLKPWKKVHTPIPPVAPAACFCRASWPLHLRCQPLLAKGLYLWDTWAMPQTPTNKKNTCWICVVKQIAYGTIHWHCPRSFQKKVSKRLLYTHPFWQGVLQVHVASAFLLLYPFWQGAFVMALGNTMKPKQSTWNYTQINKYKYINI